jgi:O-antigen ligase
VGHGFAAGSQEALRGVLMQLYGAAARHAHNAYLETLVDTGVVGLVLLVAAFVSGVLRASYVPWWSDPSDRRAGRPISPFWWHRCARAAET